MTQQSSDLKDLRDTMSHFATGMTVVTTHFEGINHGMTCNSFTTVSLEPALVLWCIRKESHSHSAFTDRAQNGGGYMVSVLAQHQQGIAMQFTQGTQRERFQNVPLALGTDSRPRLTEAVAWFDCQLEQVVTAGDHDILIGRVLQFGSQAGEALIYTERKFGTFKPL